jgi:hypothetical protein
MSIRREETPLFRTTLLAIVVLLSAPAWIGAQAAQAAAGPPEIFTGTAQAKNATGSASGTLVVRLRRITPEFDRTSVETALKEGGYPRFLTAIRNAPDVGEVILAGGKPFAIRYARERVDTGNRVLILVTDRPMYFVGGARTDAAPRTGFEVAVIALRIDAAGSGSGEMAGAARVRPDGDGGVLLDDYADELITLSGITRKPS